MNILSYPKEESDLLGLKIARANNVEVFSVEQLAAEIFEHRPDIVRMKVSMKDPELFEKVNHLGMPYNLFSFLIRKSTDTVGRVEYKNKDLTIFPYDSSRLEDLTMILNNLLNNYTGTYHTNTFYKHLIDDEKMLEAGISYFLGIADNDKKVHFFLGYINGECAGVCSFRLENKVAEGVFFGVSVKFRKLGLAHEFLTYAKEQCFKLGAEEFYTDTLIQNPGSLYPQMSIGLIPKQMFVNVVFFPLQSKLPDATENVFFEDYFDVLEKIKRWLESMGIIDVRLDEMKSLKQVLYPALPVEVTLKLFRINTENMLISVTGIHQPFWTYITASVV